MHIVFYGEDLTSLWEVEIDAVVEDVQKKKKNNLSVLPVQRIQCSPVPVDSHWDTQSAGLGFIFGAPTVIAGYSDFSQTQS